MALQFPSPDVDKLLLPFLNCLPLAFENPQPPPMLLPLLSPVLRQRIRIHSDEYEIWTASWIPFLCWDSVEAEELVSIAQHDISSDKNRILGKLEFGELERASYRKLDEETLQARTRVSELSIAISCTWCTNDTEGGEDGWRISNVGPHRSYSNDDSSSWYPTIDAAYQMYEKDHTQVNQLAANEMHSANGNAHASDGLDDEDTDEDSYWSRYDQRQLESPFGAAVPGQAGIGNLDINEEEDYYNRYDTVQPEIDANDPAEDTTAIGKSSLPGNLLIQQQRQAPEATENKDLVHIRPSSSSSSTVPHLEQFAQHQSQAEIAIQQHISSTIKSLYRLTKGAGIDVADFKRLVENEMECLSLME
ncbi:MAG: hypothetical protein GOMPHAMPRED_002218 [Gomphillus americanus]|uniref:Uncharacterized protein n=1 Tax=Gomphillus americanus TaxID=1940652 RepID=A0A8H3IMV9_9LECA|nr:MAG: hypothetical protein GOMPHAMPRED_002218 [Gomphillus americanus]